MAASNPILTPDRGKAHSVALGVLCVLAVAQMAAMVRAVWLAKSKQATPVVAQSQSPVTQPPGAPPLPPSIPAVVTRMAPPSVPSQVAIIPSAPITPPTPRMSAPVPVAAPPMDAEMRELIDLAQQLRPLGDLKGALDVLRRADTISPDHPAVLAEFAQTYELMGLGDKAAAARQKLALMNAKTGAGGLDSSPIVGSTPMPTAPGASLSPATGLTTPDAAALDPTKILGIGACEVIRDRTVVRGERVTLRLPIRSQPGVVIEPNGIDIAVFFFDLVNGERVEQTKADAPVNTWVEAPVDWKDGQERLDVVYSMPEMTPEAVRSIGQRRYHGYIVKLYYQNKLQDTVMEPASLQSFGAGSAPQTTGNPLLPPVAK